MYIYHNVNESEVSNNLFVLNQQGKFSSPLSKAFIFPFYSLKKCEGSDEIRHKWKPVTTCNDKYQYNKTYLDQKNDLLFNLVTSF